MKKIYLFFVNDDKVINGLLHLDYFPDTIGDYVNDVWYSLYAWTTKKKYKNNFYQLRKKEYFHLVEKEISEEDLRDFRTGGTGSLELEEYEYQNISTKLKLITTQFEFDMSRHLWIDILSDNVEKIFGYIPYSVTSTLKKEYQDALYMLGVNALLLIADDELSNFIDHLDFSLDDDYVLDIPAVFGENFLGRKVTIPVSIAGKTLNSFIHIFKDILTDEI